MQPAGESDANLLVAGFLRLFGGGGDPGLTDPVVGTLSRLGLVSRREAGPGEGPVITPWARQRAAHVLEALGAGEDVEAIRLAVRRALVQVPGTLLVYADEGVTREDFDLRGREPGGPSWHAAQVAPLGVAPATGEIQALREAIDDTCRSRGLRSPDGTYVDRHGLTVSILEWRDGGQIRFRPVDPFTGQGLGGPKAEARRRVIRAELQGRVDSALGPGRWTVRATPGIVTFDLFPCRCNKALARDHLLAGVEVGCRRQVVCLADRPDGNDGPLLGTPLPEPSDRLVFLSVGEDASVLEGLRVEGRIADGIAAWHVGGGCDGSSRILSGLLDGLRRRRGPVSTLAGLLAQGGAPRSLTDSLKRCWTDAEPLTLALDLDGTIVVPDGRPVAAGMMEVLRDLDEHGCQVAILTGKRLGGLKKIGMFEGGGSGRIGRGGAMTAEDRVAWLSRSLAAKAAAVAGRALSGPGRSEIRAALDFLAGEPNLVAAIPDEVARVVDLAFRTSDDDVRHHASVLAGRLLLRPGASERIVVSVVSALQCQASRRAALAILAEATRSQAVRGAMESMGTAARDVRLIAMMRTGCAPLADLSALRVVGEILEYLERASKRTRGGILEEPPVRERLDALLGGDPATGLASSDWRARALAADRLGVAREIVREWTELLKDGMMRDPEPEVRVRSKRAFVARISGIPDTCLAEAAGLVESMGRLDEGALRYMAGAIASLVEVLLPDSRAVPLVRQVVAFAKEPADPYARKTAVKLCAKLAGRLTASGLRDDLAGVAIDRLGDPEWGVRTEAFLSICKRGIAPFLSPQQRRIVLVWVAAQADSPDPATILVLATGLASLECGGLPPP